MSFAAQPSATRCCWEPCAAATRATGDLAVAYLPDNDAIELDVSVFPSPLAARWFDPVNGRYTSVAGRIENRGAHRFARPANGDWVLLLQRTGG
jgi:hypothetical protein